MIVLAPRGRRGGAGEEDGQNFAALDETDGGKGATCDGEPEPEKRPRLRMPA